MDTKHETQPTPLTVKQRIAAIQARLAKVRNHLAGRCPDCGKTLKASADEVLAERRARHVRNCPQRVR